MLRDIKQLWLAWRGQLCTVVLVLVNWKCYSTVHLCRAKSLSCTWTVPCRGNLHHCLDGQRKPKSSLRDSFASSSVCSEEPPFRDVVITDYACPLPSVWQKGSRMIFLKKEGILLVDDIRVICRGEASVRDRKQTPIALQCIWQIFGSQTTPST